MNRHLTCTNIALTST